MYSDMMHWLQLQSFYCHTLTIWSSTPNKQMFYDFKNKLFVHYDSFSYFFLFFIYEQSKILNEN